LVTLDTDVLVSLLRGAPDAVQRIGAFQENGEELSTTIITAYELAKGACISSRPDENLARVRETMSNLRIFELTLGGTEEASRIYKDLRDRGKTIGEFDVLIAGIVKFNDERLLTRDEHFKQIHGMKVINW
jgi:predicted nucleic acid-binding protein